ncbi:MAG: hypothetical protein IJU23_02155 [Proteobacteria bacterium]|nr:hypothetical protein [Pseudomonadota bacterium]
MNTSEAIQQIERWLLVPVDYDAVIPALAAIRNTEDFDRYAAKIADAEYKAKSVVIENVDAYIEKTSKEPTQEELLAQKLKQISGNSTATPQKDLNARYNNFVQGYVSGNGPHQNSSSNSSNAPGVKETNHREPGSAMTKQCSNCHCDMVIFEKEEFTAGIVIIYFILFCIIGPFIVIPILLKIGTEKKKYYRCPKCCRVHKL